ncbi:MAG: UDP-N-acetylmuramate dehydrogenase [Erysipelotrichaceae bacterium]|nr:UDP-N-acetylmuramate dehydrogenase [Erysipelotrichaceae bacterium]
MDFRNIYYRLQALDVGLILRDEPMYKHTTYKVGGAARLFVYIKDIDSLKSALNFLRQENVPHMVIGKGSDVLFSDREYEGVIISLDHLNRIEFNGNVIVAQAGAGLIPLAYQSAKVGLTGMEFMGGIPGAVGGGIYMNAGAYNSSISAICQSVRILNEHNEIVTLSNEEMQFGYRTSILQAHPEWIVLDAVFILDVGDPVAIHQLLDKRKERRMSTQPWNFACAGSVFRNPDDQPAWKYVDEVGMRGYEIGGAQVSPKHSNFIVNNGYASARDILDLIELVQFKVWEKFGVKLKTEVILVNWE